MEGQSQDEGRNPGHCFGVGEAGGALAQLRGQDHEHERGGEGYGDPGAAVGRGGQRGREGAECEGEGRDEAAAEILVDSAPYEAHGE